MDLIGPDMVSRSKVLTKMVSTNMVLTSLHKYGLDKHGLVKHGLDKHDLDKHGLDIVLTNLVLTTWSCQTWSRHGLSIMVLTNNLLAVLDCLSILLNWAQIVKALVKPKCFFCNCQIHMYLCYGNFQSAFLQICIMFL